VTRGPLHAAAESRAPFPSQAQGFDLTFQHFLSLIEFNLGDTYLSFL
jgi:hypothetical protein